MNLTGRVSGRHAGLPEGHIVIRTGTLLGGYADDVYNLLFRLETTPSKSHPLLRV